MVFKEIWSAIMAESPLGSALEDTSVMIERTRNMFESSYTSLLENNEELAKAIIDEDMKVDRLEVKVRKKILEHLAASTIKNISYSLTLTNMIRDIERVGDYSKSIAELTFTYPAKLKDGKCMDLIEEMKKKTSSMFELTEKAIREDEKGSAKKAIKLYGEVLGDFDRVVEVLNNPETCGPHAITFGLLSVYLKRIAGHLQNISSTELYPFPQTGFGTKPEE